MLAARLVEPGSLIFNDSQRRNDKSCDICNNVRLYIGVEKALGQCLKFRDHKGGSC